MDNGVLTNYQICTPSTTNAGPKDPFGKPGPYEEAVVNTPILEQIRSYLASDFYYHAVYDKCIREQDAAIATLRKQIAGKSAADRKRFEEALDLFLD